MAPIQVFFVVAMSVFAVTQAVDPSCPSQLEACLLNFGTAQAGIDNAYIEKLCSKAGQVGACLTTAIGKGCQSLLNYRDYFLESKDGICENIETLAKYATCMEGVKGIDCVPPSAGSQFSCATFTAFATCIINEVTATCGTEAGNLLPSMMNPYIHYAAKEANTECEDLPSSATAGTSAYQATTLVILVSIWIYGQQE